ncbi:MAG: phage tail tape measure protein [Candidatus Heimdallarchaeaceae archaeon]
MAGFRGAKGSVTILDKATRPLKSIANAFKNLGTQSKKTNKDLSGTQKAIASIAKSQNRLNRVNQNIKRNTKDIGSQAVGVAAIALAFKAALNPAIKFEQSMKDLEAVAFGTADATVPVAKNMALLSEQSKKLGSTTAFTAIQAAEGQLFLAKAGFKTNQILKTMPSLLDLASASNTELGRTSDILSDLLGAFGMKAAQSGKLADVMAAATSSANVDMETLFETLKVAAPIGKRFGATMQEITTATALLGNVGIKGSMAGTALKNMFTNLASPAASGAKVMKELGINVEDSSGKLLPMQDIMQNLGKSAKTLSQAKQIKVFSAVFGKIAMAGALNLEKAVNSGDFAKMLKNLQNSEGIASKMAKIRMDSTEGSLVQLMSAVEGLAISFGTILTPIVRGVAKVMTAITEPMQDFIKNNESLITGIGIFAGALLVAKVATLGYTAVMWLVTPAITALSVALKVVKMGMIAFNFVMAANPIGLMVVGITALIAAGALLVENWEPVKTFFSDLWETIKGLASSFAELPGVQGFSRGIDRTIDAGSAIFDNVSSFFGGSPDDATKAINANNTTNVPVAINVSIQDGKLKGVESSGATTTDVFLNSGSQF